MALMQQQTTVTLKATTKDFVLNCQSSETLLVMETVKSTNVTEMFNCEDHDSSDSSVKPCSFTDSGRATSTEVVGAASDLVKERSCSANDTDIKRKHIFSTPELPVLSKRMRNDNDPFYKDSGNHNKEDADENGTQDPDKRDEQYGDSVNGEKILCSVQSSTGTSSGGISNVEDTGGPKTIAEVLKELVHERSMLCMQWAQIFEDGQKFEKFCPARLDSILQEAKQLEKSLIEQKAALGQRLQALSRTLQSTYSEESKNP